MQNPSSAASGEGERLLAIAEKLLRSRDLAGANEFAILAQENEPLLEGSDQILAVVEVLTSSEKRVNNSHYDWYSILQIEHRTEDIDLIKKQYRRLALLLHPDKNNYPFADQAFKLVSDAWATLSDTVKKPAFDRYLDLVSGGAQTQQNRSGSFQINFGAQNYQQQQVKLPVRRSEMDSRGKKKGPENGNVSLSFWTACPYCYVLYEFPRAYEGCCLRCERCHRAFHGAEIPALPPLADGEEAYYCCWAFFPLGFKGGDGAMNRGKEFPNWMPPMFNAGRSISSNARPVQQNTYSTTQFQHQSAQPQQAQPLRMGVEMSFGVRSADVGIKKKRGRPRKNPL